MYLDPLGNPTVGYGHRVILADHLKLGDTITSAQADDYLKQDTATALKAAKKQAAEISVTDGNFITVLASVNYQLGTNWRSAKFPNAWQAIVSGNYEEAIQDIKKSD